MIPLPTKFFLAVALSAITCGFALADSKEATTGKSDSSEIQVQHSVLKSITGPFKSTIPRVWLSDGHAKQCKVGVGESFPTMKLPNLSGAMTDLVSLRGRQATVVLFWHPDRWMARTALIDMQRDLVKKFDSEQVAVVGIAVHQQADSLRNLLGEVHAEFPQLVDTEGEALSKVGTLALPRIYVLDSEGTIVWFDIEYSEATRRELQQALASLTVDPSVEKAAGK